MLPGNMKINSDSLLSNEHVYEVNRPLRSNECSLDIQCENGKVYSVKTLEIINEYCHSKDFIIVDTLKEAMLECRNKNIKALSLREADIATRSRCLDNNGVLFSLMNGCLLSEGIPGNAESGYELRRRYNRGKEWFSKNRTASIENIEKANGILADIVLKLNSLGLLLWPEEKSGFHVDLLRPEYMSEYQYIQITRKVIFDG